MSRIGQRLEKTPEATFLRELDEENTNLRDALQQSVIVTWQGYPQIHGRSARTPGGLSSS